MLSDLAAVVWTGVIKLAAAPFVEAIRRVIPPPAAMTVFGAAIYSYLALVLLQRLFDHPLIGLVTLAIVATSVLGSVPITRWRIPPLAVAWLVPLGLALAVGYVRLDWHGVAFTLPFVPVPDLLSSMQLAVPYLSVIVAMGLFNVLGSLQNIESADAAGDSYETRPSLTPKTAARVDPERSPRCQGSPPSGIRRRVVACWAVIARKVSEIGRAHV